MLDKDKLMLNAIKVVEAVENSDIDIKKLMVLVKTPLMGVAAAGVIKRHVRKLTGHRLTFGNAYSVMMLIAYASYVAGRNFRVGALETEEVLEVARSGLKKEKGPETNPPSPLDDFFSDSLFRGNRSSVTF